MKKRLSIIACGLVAVTMLGAVPLTTAHGEDASNEASTTQSDNSTANAIRERLEKKKVELQARLDDAQKQRIQSRCKAALGIITSISENTNGRVVVRQQAYSKILEKLASLITKLQAKGIDTSLLESQLATLKEDIANFDTDLEAHKQAISDLKAVDCEADPEAFKTALEVARDTRSQLINDAVHIRDYLNNTVKETLKTIRQQLGAADDSSAEDTQQTTTGSEGSN